MRSTLLLFSLVVLLTTAGNSQVQSTRVYEDANGYLRYTADEQHNYIPNFSFVGYHKGEKALPSYSPDLTIDPLSGDNTAHIQQAIDALAAFPLDSNGHRGCLLLNPGLYEVQGTIRISASGIVLRGSGSGTDTSSQTIIHATGNSPAERSVFILGSLNNISWDRPVSQAWANLSGPFVPAGSRSITVNDLSLFQPGDEVIVMQKSTTDWLASIDFGSTDTDAPWTQGEIDIEYHRVIDQIDSSESKIVLDAPIYDHLDTSLTFTQIFPFNEVVPTEMGIEDLRIEIESTDSLSQDHARNGVLFEGVADSWAKNIVARRFSYAAVETGDAVRITVKDCQGLNPHSPIAGGWRYNFVSNRNSNLILFEACSTSYGRHAYVANGTSTSTGIVWTNCHSEADFSVSEGHRRWSHGLLFDQIAFENSNTSRLIGLYNRGRFGTGHGWSSAHSVAWNVSLPPSGQMVIQRPPHRQNYAIGCQGTVTAAHTFTHPIGFVEHVNETLVHPSLYQLQLGVRLSKGIAPDGPAKLTALQFSDSVRLEWLDIAALETAYVVERSLDGGTSFQAIAQLNENTTFYIDQPGISNFDSLVYRVASSNANGLSAYSNPAGVELPLSNEALVMPSPLTVFPNPVNDLLYLKYDGKGHYEIYDALGREWVKGGTGHELDVSGWPSGMYILTFVQDGQRYSTRIVKK